MLLATIEIRIDSAVAFCRTTCSLFTPRKRTDCMHVSAWLKQCTLMFHIPHARLVFTTIVNILVTACTHFHLAPRLLGFVMFPKVFGFTGLPDLVIISAGQQCKPRPDFLLLKPRVHDEMAVLSIGKQYFALPHPRLPMCKTRKHTRGKQSLYAHDP